MGILLWLVPSIVATALAMAWVAWAGHRQESVQEPSEAARARRQRRFAEAIQREHPGSVRTRHTPRDRSTGIAVRPSRQTPHPGAGQGRRTA